MLDNNSSIIWWEEQDTLPIEWEDKSIEWSDNDITPPAIEWWEELED